jgi:hypothetical protein
MKTFVKAKKRFTDELIEGNYYEVISKIKSDSFANGKGILFVNDSGRFVAFDSSFFE